MHTSVTSTRGSAKSSLRAYSNILIKAATEIVMCTLQKCSVTMATTHLPFSLSKTRLQDLCTGSKSRKRLSAVKECKQTGKFQVTVISNMVPKVLGEWLLLCG